MAKYKVIYEREGCIGAGACAAVLPEVWIMDEDNKANLVNGQRLENGNFELIIDEKDLQKHLEAAETCPVNVIHIINLETGEKLI